MTVWPKACPCGSRTCDGKPAKIPRGAIYDARKANRAVMFFNTYLRHMKGRWAGQPFVLEPWQEWHIVRPLFGFVERKTGHRQFREAMIGLPRKNGKSEIAAGIALYMLVADGEYGAEVYSLAGDRKQASLVFGTAKQMILADPLLKAACRPYRSVVEVPDTGSTYRALSADADLQHGLNPYCAVVDEYHVHKNAEQYEAMRTGTAAREQPLIVTITTAGANEEGPCWDLYLRGKDGKDPRFYFYWVGAKADDPADDPTTWLSANPASWITKEFLADQYRSLPLVVFERLHLNRWPTAGSAAWVPLDKWNDCGGKPIIDPELPCVVAVDAAPKRDKTAVVLDQIDKDGVHNVLCWTWQASPDLGYLDFAVVEEFLRDLYRDFRVTRIVVDPYAMIRSMMILAAEGLPVEDFPQNHTRMAPASMALFELITTDRLRHGNDPELTSAVRAATVRETPFGWRLDKRQGTSHHIDPVVALAMAARIAEQEGALDGPRVLVV